MSGVRRRHPASFKARVALEALKELLTIAQLSAQYGVHSTQIRQWKKDASKILLKGFSDKRDKNAKEHEALLEELYKQIGQQKVALDWLKKNLVGLGTNKRSLIEADNSQISIAKQCELIGLNRTTYYYEPAPINEETLLLMRLLDEQYTKTPFSYIPKTK